MICFTSASPIVHSSSYGLYSASKFVSAHPVSRSLGTSFSELTGQPTPPYLHVPGPSTVAPITRTTETLSSSVASLEPPATVIHIEPQAAPVIDPT